MKSMIKMLTMLPAVALFSACATTSETAPQPQNTTAATSVTSLDYDRMMPERYTCGDAGDIMAKQSLNKQQVMLTATLPSLKLDNQAILLNQTTTDSGFRYVNATNPDTALQWHMKGDLAMFSVNWANGKNYKALCKKL